MEFILEQLRELSGDYPELAARIEDLFRARQFGPEWADALAELDGVNGIAARMFRAFTQLWTAETPAVQQAAADVLIDVIDGIVGPAVRAQAFGTADTIISDVVGSQAELAELSLRQSDLPAIEDLRDQIYRAAISKLDEAAEAGIQLGDETANMLRGIIDNVDDIPDANLVRTLELIERVNVNVAAGASAAAQAVSPIQVVAPEAVAGSGITSTVAKEVAKEGVKEGAKEGVKAQAKAQVRKMKPVLKRVLARGQSARRTTVKAQKKLQRVPTRFKAIVGGGILGGTVASRIVSRPERKQKGDCESATKTMLDSMAQGILRDAKRRVPVDDGGLKASLTVKVEKTRVGSVGEVVVNNMRGAIEAWVVVGGNCSDPSAAVQPVAKIVLRSGVNYGYWVEVGTKTRKPTPYARPALSKGRTQTKVV